MSDRLPPLGHRTPNQEAKRSRIIVEREVAPRTTSPKDMLESVYRLIKQDIDNLTQVKTLTATQSQVARDHGEFLIRACRELRQQAKDEAARYALMTDDELREILSDPALRAHLKQLIQEYDDDGARRNSSQTDGSSR